MADRLSILKERQENTQKLLELTKRKAEMLKKLRAEEMEMLNQELAHYQMKMLSLNAIFDSMNEKDKYDNFRSSCQKIIRQFKKFQTLFLEDYDSMKPILDRGENWSTRDSDKLDDAQAVLQNLLDLAYSLTVIQDKEIRHSQLEKSRKIVVECSEDLNTKLLDIIVEIEEEEDVVSLKKLYRDADLVVKRMALIMDEFDIPPTKRLEQVVSKHMEIAFSKMAAIQNSNLRKQIRQ